VLYKEFFVFFKCFLSQLANFTRECCHQVLSQVANFTRKGCLQVLSQVANFAGEHDPCGLYDGRLANVEMFSFPNGELYKEMLYPGVVPNGELYKEMLYSGVVPSGEFYIEMLSLGVVPSGEFCWRE
jgi:hypothetical protein